MILKGLAVSTLLLAVMQAPVPVPGQATRIPVANPQSQTRPASSLPAAQNPSSPENPTGRPDCNGVPCEEQQPRITVSVPPPAPLPWTLQERIAWAANLVLVVLGYVGVMMGLSTLKKIERYTKATEITAAAALESSQAALWNAQAIINSERPWLLITIEPSLTAENRFTVKCKNRGRTPARIIAAIDRIKIAIDETHLPASPEYGDEEPSAPLDPIILLPGESTGLKQFARDDVKGICETEETFKRVETWEEKIFIYGKVIYRDLIAPEDKQTHETNWCCWFIHGRQKSGLVIAGPPEYNEHT
jgi:hypothetical protein